jgi:hypothetical protein
MTRVYLAAIAIAVLGCETTPYDRWNPEAAALSCPPTDPPDCGATLPAMITWPDGSPTAPLPPPQTDTGVVLVADSFDDPEIQWAFSVEAGKLTGWLAFPRSRLGELVMQVMDPTALLKATKGMQQRKATVKMVKVPTPKDPRLAPDPYYRVATDLQVGPDPVFLLEAAALELEVEAGAAAAAKLCQ